MQTAKQTIYTQIAKAKLVHNKKTDTYKLVVAFNVTEITEKGAYKFPPSKQCAYVSGDIEQTEVLQAMQIAAKHIRSNNIVLVS